MQDIMNMLSSCRQANRKQKSVPSQGGAPFAFPLYLQDSCRCEMPGYPPCSHRSPSQTPVISLLLLLSTETQRHLSLAICACM